MMPTCTPRLSTFAPSNPSQRRILQLSALSRFVATLIVLHSSSLSSNIPRHTRSSRRSIRIPPRIQSNSTAQPDSLASNRRRRRYVVEGVLVGIAFAVEEDTRSRRLRVEGVRRTRNAARVSNLPLPASHDAQVKATHLLGILRIALGLATVLRTALLVVLLGRHCQVCDLTEARPWYGRRGCRKFWNR